MQWRRGSFKWRRRGAALYGRAPLFWPSAVRVSKTSTVTQIASSIVTMHNVLGDGLHEEKGVPCRQGGPVHLPVRPPLRQVTGGLPATFVSGQANPPPLGPMYCPQPQQVNASRQQSHAKALYHLCFRFLWTSI